MVIIVSVGSHEGRSSTWEWRQSIVVGGIRDDIPTESDMASFSYGRRYQRTSEEA